MTDLQQKLAAQLVSLIEARQLGAILEVGEPPISAVSRVRKANDNLAEFIGANWPMIIEHPSPDEAVTAPCGGTFQGMLLAAAEEGHLVRAGTIKRNRSGDLVPRAVLDEAVGNFYIDCEFDGHGGPMISFAIVRQDGSGMHITLTDAPPPVDPWVAENVMSVLDKHCASQVARVRTNDLGATLRAFIGDCVHPVIVADSPVDIGRFCAALSTGADGGWASADYSAMTFRVHNVDCYPTDLPGAVQHNAWWDAMALRAFLAKHGGGDAN